MKIIEFTWFGMVFNLIIICLDSSMKKQTGKYFIIEMRRGNSKETRIEAKRVRENEILIDSGWIVHAPLANQSCQ